MRTILPALVVLSFAACSERPQPTGPGGDGDAIEVGIENFRFSPARVEAPVGTTVRWRNTTSTFHTVTPDGHGEWQEFQTNASGDVLNVRFDGAGTFDYFCVPHQSLGMTGQVVIR